MRPRVNGFPVLLLLLCAVASASGAETLPPASPASSANSAKTISLDLVDTDIHAAAKIFADLMQRNIVVAPGVAGRVTLRLQDVFVEQAFETMLRMHGLRSERVGSVIMVRPLRQ